MTLANPFAPRRLGRQSTDCKECSGTGMAMPNCKCGGSGWENEHGAICTECHDMPCGRCDGTGEERAQ